MDTFLTILALLLLVTGVTVHFAIPKMRYIGRLVFAGFFLTIGLERIVSGGASELTIMLTFAAAIFFLYQAYDIWQKGRHRNQVR